MRTTITISEELLQAAKDLSGKKSQSDAIVSSLEDYVEIKKRLRLLEDLFASRVPHRMRKVKAGRRTRDWSS
jgi:Arc/MetJ family transcription regulator